MQEESAEPPGKISRRPGNRSHTKLLTRRRWGEGGGSKASRRSPFFRNFGALEYWGGVEGRAKKYQNFT